VLMVPVVTPHAIEKMINHDSVDIDDVLAEWLIAVVILEYSDIFATKPRLKKLCPLIMAGTLAGQEYRCPLKDVAVVHPSATAEMVLRLFSKKGAAPDEVVDFIQKSSVKSIVNGIMRNIGEPLMVEQCNMETAAAETRYVVGKSTHQTWKVLQTCG
jgi:predicted HAD superfamily phosphohydrolase